MSIKTIQCRLVADEEVLRHVWELMAEKNTPLINEIFNRLQKCPGVEQWFEKGQVPDSFIKELCKSLKTQEPFAGQPGRFYTSAETMVKEAYKSLFALQQKRKRQLDGKKRYLAMLRSDIELQKESNCSLELIRAEAKDILVKFTEKFAQAKQNKEHLKKKENKNKKSFDKTLFSILFDTYEKTENVLSKCAIAYLLKNKCQISSTDENEDEYNLYRRKKEIEIERLNDQLKKQLPNGRDLNSNTFLRTLEIIINSFTVDENEFKSWQANLLKTPSNLPYPVDYETNEDLTWLFNAKERIYVSFTALGDKRENSRQVDKHKFEVWCDKRHLHFFKRFVEDINVKKQGDKKNSQKQYSAGLLTFRSGRIIWKEGKKGYKKHSKKGEPWNLNHLELHCTFDTRLWTKEGTEIVRLEKINAANKTIYNRQQRGELSETQQRKLEHKISERTKLENTFPGRPSKPLYQGKSHILVGVSLGLEKPATIAVFDAANNKVLTYRSTKQLLGDNYNLLNRQRQQKQRLAHQRHKVQKQFAPNDFGESELGQYIDRLLSKEIMAIAINYSAGSIAVPKLSDIREIIQSEVQAKAEKKIPGYIEGQKNYAKEYRKSIHSWSYGRLIKNIQIQAAQAGISIETGQQPTKGSPQEQAKDLALFSYQCRIA